MFDKRIDLTFELRMGPVVDINLALTQQAIVGRPRTDAQSLDYSQKSIAPNSGFALERGWSASDVMSACICKSNCPE